MFIFDKFRAGHRLAEIANCFGIDEENQLPQFREAKVIHPRVLPEINNELRKFLPVNHGGNFALLRQERKPGWSADLGQGNPSCNRLCHAPNNPNYLNRRAHRFAAVTISRSAARSPQMA